MPVETLQQLKETLHKDKDGWAVVEKDCEVDFQQGDKFILKVGRKYKKIKFE